MHGYNAEKNIWQVEGRDGRRELPTKRGLKSTVQAYRNYSQKLKSYTHNMLFMYRRPTGEWYAA